MCTAVRLQRHVITLEFNFEGQRVVASVVATLLRVLVRRGNRGGRGSTRAAHSTGDSSYPYY